ncbi:MAG TPA: glycosyltransferase family 39 protein [Thermoanaerobaculia bacterium]|nr:glycosyltransferase family 39 protein [Thermoanaerobaculia bacterium]
MRELAGNLGGVALFVLPGLALTCLFPSLRSMPLLRRLGYGYLLGVATIAGSLYALSALLQVPLRRPAIFGVAALVTILGLAGWRRTLPKAPRLSLGARTAMAALSLAGVIVTVGVFADAISEPLKDWDGRMHWAAQARYIREEGSVLPLAVVREQWFINHPRYPVLLPVAQAAVLEVTGAREDEQFFRGLYAAFFPALLLVLYDGARRWAGWLPADIVVTTVAGLAFFSFFPEGGAISSYSDLPLACFYGAALVLLLRGRKRFSDGIAAGILLGAAVLTKNEGALLAVFALLTAVVASIRHFRSRAAHLAAASAILFLSLTLFLVWRSQIPNRQDEGYEVIAASGHLFPDVITRIPEFGPEILRRTLLTWDHWTGFWWLAPLVLLAGAGGLRGRRKALSWPLLLGFAAPLAIAWGAYSIQEHSSEVAKVTWERFLMQGSLPFFLLFSLALRSSLQAAFRWRVYRKHPERG